MLTFQPGDQVMLDFKDLTDSDGLAYNPPQVKWHVKSPLGGITTYTFGTDNNTEKIIDGWYRCVVSVPYTRPSVGIWSSDAQALDAQSESLLVESGKFNVENPGTFA